MRQLSMARRRRQRGLTLIELAIGMVIAAFLMAVAAPFFGDYIRNARLREGGNALLSETLFAQSEAIKRNAAVRLATNGASLQVLDVSDAANPVLLREHTMSGGVAAPVKSVDFGSEGRPVPFGTNASIDLLLAGMSCSADTRCPGLRIDAGGAARLCGNHLSSCP